MQSRLFYYWWWSSRIQMSICQCCFRKDSGYDKEFQNDELKFSLHLYIRVLFPNLQGLFHFYSNKKLHFSQRVIVVFPSLLKEGLKKIEI